jgi:membrane protein implicated in regulation of membrane protease activity
MTQESERCPSCDAAMPLLSGIRHCRCGYCGSKFAVDWTDEDTPILTRFEDILAAGGGGDVALAGEKTDALEVAVADADHEVEAQQEQLRRTQSAYRSEVQAFGEAIQGPQAWTLAAGLLAAVMWFLVVFVLEGLPWYLGLVAAVLLSFLAREVHRRWQGTEQRMQLRIAELGQMIEQAQVGVQEAQAHREDAYLERELWQAKASNQRVLPAS